MDARLLLCMSLLFGGCVHSEQKRKLSQINRKLKKLERENRKLSQNLREKESWVRRSPKSNFTDDNLCGRFQSMLSVSLSDCLNENRKFNHHNKRAGMIYCLTEFKKESDSVLNNSRVYRDRMLNMGRNQYKQIGLKLGNDYKRNMNNCRHQDYICEDQAMLIFLTDFSKLDTGCQLTSPSVVQPI